MDALQTARATFTGRASSRLLQVGFLFTLELHPREECNIKHLITSIAHRGVETQALLEEGGIGQEETQVYEARFSTLPRDVTWRPPLRTARPVITGVQTALVVGPAGNEIYCDELGRVKVQFYWDRMGNKDEKSSCWVRVSHPWAGQGFGMISLPRVGQEVIVQFIEGDPDRPMIVGRVYNGDNPAPYSLPDHKTRSTWQSRSSPGGGGSNELRFEDLTGKEEVYIHAQKDFNEVVEHNHSTNVTANQSISVGGNPSTSVTGDQTNTVTGKQTEVIKKNRSIEVTEGEDSTTIKANKSTLTVHLDRTVTVQSGNHTVNVESGSHTLAAKQAISITSKTAGISEIASTTIEAGAGQRITHEAPLIESTARDTVVLTQGSANFTLTGNHAELNTGSYIKLHHGSGTIEIEESGKIKLSSGTEIELSVGGSSIKITDGRIEIGGNVEVKIDGGSGHVKLDAAGATVTGTKITSSASTLNEISGAVVTIN